MRRRGLGVVRAVAAAAAAARLPVPAAGPGGAPRAPGGPDHRCTDHRCPGHQCTDHRCTAGPGELWAEVEALRRRVRELGDRMEIQALIDRYVTLLDTQDEDGFDESWPATVFTDDVRLRFPIGSHRGLEGVAGFHHRAKARFDRTLHTASNYAVRLDGDRARVRLHMTATHVHGDKPTGPFFGIGGPCGGLAVRTERGWRLAEWEYDLTWASGPGPNGTPLVWRGTHYTPS